jgi:SAM-dependent methyltransferase
VAIRSSWTKKFFRWPIFDPGEPEAMGQAAREARFAAKALRLRRGERLLDLCCGVGRHSFELARLGAAVTGLDATPAYLAAAKKRLGRRSNPSFVLGDMRRLRYEAEFDAAVNLWTSFGYFEDPADDLKVLKGVARALKPGGRFLMDMIDGDWVAESAPPRNWTRRADGTTVLEEVVVRRGRDPAHFNTWTVLKPGRAPQCARFFVRNYGEARLRGLLARAGLVFVRRWEGFGTGAGRSRSKRLIVLSKKL